MQDLNKAINLLIEDKTCILVKDTITFCDNQKGIKPMMDFISKGFDLKGFSVADKIVGKAAAMLFIYSGISNVYGEVMSISAMNLLDNYHIPYQYKIKTDVIINRKGDDICPMEKAVSNIFDIQQGYLVLRKQLDNLNK